MHEPAGWFPKIFCRSPSTARRKNTGARNLGNFRQKSREPKALWRLTQTGNGMGGELEFERLVELHHAPLYRFAMSLCHNEDEASELVQETFLTWATKGHQLNDSGKAKSWLFTSLHRDFLGRRRRQTRFPHHELDTVAVELPEGEPVAIDSLDWSGVLDALKQVDSTFQAPVALFYLEDYAYNEIAEILEVPLGTVKSRIARGIAQLQQLMSAPKRQRPDRTPPQ